MAADSLLSYYPGWIPASYESKPCDLLSAWMHVCHLFYSSHLDTTPPPRSKRQHLWSSHFVLLRDRFRLKGSPWPMVIRPPSFPLSKGAPGCIATHQQKLVNLPSSHSDPGTSPPFLPPLGSPHDTLSFAKKEYLGDGLLVYFLHEILF